MPAVALKDESQRLAGFLLVAGDEPLAPTTGRVCLFMVPPLPWPSKTKDFLFERKHREFSVAIADDGTGLKLSASPAPGEVFEAHLPRSGLGAWSITHPAGVAGGQCELAKPK